MTTLFPIALDDFQNPAPTTSQAASRTHSQRISDLNDAVEALQRTVGVSNSSDSTSLHYKVKQISTLNSVSASNAAATGLNSTETQIGSVTINVRSASSKILIIARSDLQKDTGTATRAVTARIRRGTSNTDPQVGLDTTTESAGVADMTFGPVVILGQDSPGVTGNVTYTLRGLANVAFAATALRWEIQAIELQGIKGEKGDPGGSAIDPRDYGALGDASQHAKTAFDTAAGVALSTGKTMFIPEGLWALDEWNPPAGLRVVGAGEGAVLVPFSAAGPGAYSVVSLSDDVEISHVKVLSDYATKGEKIGIYASGRDNVRVHDVWIDQCSSSFVGYSCTNSRVDRVNATGWLYNGISFDGPGTRNCHIDDFDTDGLQSIVNGMGAQILDGLRCSITRARPTNCWGFGCYISTSDDSYIDGVLAHNTRLESCQITASDRCTMRNVIATWDVGKGEDFGVSMWAPGALNCNYCTIENVHVFGSFKAGISMEADDTGTMYHTKISRCYVYNPNQKNDPADPWAGIVVYGVGCRHTQVDGNKVFSTDGKMPYGIREVGGADYNVYDGNVLDGHTIFRLLREGANSIESNNGRRWGEAGTGWNPAISATSGTITSVDSVIGNSYENERMVKVFLSINAVDNGTGAGALVSSLPYSTGPYGAYIYGTNLMTNKAVIGRCDGATVTMRYADGTYPIATGQVIQLTGEYERA